MRHDHDLVSQSDTDLLAALDRLVASDRHTTAELLAQLGEVDERRLYAREAFPSMFAYCTGRLRMDEGAAYKRIRAARAARRFPVILDMVAAGELHLTAIVLV